jgi:hypothetical protein
VQNPNKWKSVIPAYGLIDCKILYDPEGIIKLFQQEAKTYPKKLKEMVFLREKRYINFIIKRLNKAVIFNDPILFFIESSTFINSLFRILGNLNEKHIDPVDFKWAVKVLSTFTIKPDNFLKRINSIFLNVSCDTVDQKHRELLKLYKDIEKLQVFPKK